MKLVKKTMLSVVVHTKNSARTLERTLASVTFADEIVVIDMHSTDETEAIAKRFTKKIFQHKDMGYVEPARNFGFSKATHPWLLVLDDDEVVSDGLRQVIQKTLTNPESDVYFLPRKNKVFGQWIQRTGWWPDYQPRFFKKGTLSWPEQLHSVPTITGTQFHFPAEETYAITHYNYDSVEQFIEKLNTYTTIQAPERLKHNLRERFSVEEMMLLFANEFGNRAFAKNGVEDGMHGMSLSLMQAMYEATIYLKQWGTKNYPPIETGNFGRVLDEMMKIWRYWWADYQVRRTRGLTQWYWRVRRKFKV